MTIADDRTSEHVSAVGARASWQDSPEVAAEVDELRRAFSDPSLSIAEVLCDRHPREAVAFTVIDRESNCSRLTYGELADDSSRLATALRERGVRRGDRIGVLMGKSRQLPVVLLAIWRLGAVHVPLFTAFAGPAIALRLRSARARVLIADEDQRSKADGLDIPILTTGGGLDDLIRSATPLAVAEAIGADGTFIQLYTSGTTGAPKGVEVPGFAIAAFTAYMRYGLDVREDDVFWNAADPGWAYGLYFAIVGPLATGRANILLEGGFSAENTAAVIDDLGVTNLAASPTVFRAMKRSRVTLRRRLRAVSSAGEPLTPDVTAWSQAALGSEVRDHWGQTEHGMAIVNAWDPRLRTTVVAGSMGSAMPGFVAGTVGSSIALSVERSMLMWFRGYTDDPAHTAERFTNDGAWYLTGDVGREESGNFFFASRDDDVILAAGYRIAPFDIETIIVADGDVAEAAVVGRPDELRGEVVEAFVVLSGEAASGDLQDRIQSAVRAQYGAHAYPRRVHVVDALPKTPSGKVQRFVLRALPESELPAARHEP